MYVSVESISNKLLNEKVSHSVFNRELITDYAKATIALCEKRENSSLLKLVLSKNTKEKKVKLAHHKTGIEQNTIFQVVIASTDSNGDLTMTMGLFYFTLHGTTENWLSSKIHPSDIQLFWDVQHIILNSSVWNNIKSPVTEKLKSVIQKETGQIKC